MASEANSIKPLDVSTDTGYNPILKEFIATVTMIAQAETPFLSRTRRRNTAGMSEPRHQWQLRDLNDITTSGIMTARPMGDNTSPVAVNQPKLRANYAQTQYKVISVAKEEEGAAKWQMGSRMAYEMMRTNIEMRKAIETIILTKNQSSRAATVANSFTPLTGTLHAIVGTYSEIGVTANSVTPSAPGWNSTNNQYQAGTRASTDAGRKLLTFSDLRAKVDEVWEDVSTLTRSMSVYLSLAMKHRFDTFENETLAAYRQMVTTDGKIGILSCIDFFKTTAGTFSVTPLPHMNGSNTVWVVNPAMVTIFGYFFNYMFTLGRKGLSTERGVAWNWGLRVETEAGMAAFYDRKTS